MTRENVRKTVPQGLFDEIIFGNTYNYFIDETSNKFKPNYDRLKNIAISSATVLNTSANIPVEFVNMMQAVLIMFVAAQHFLSGWKNKVIFNTSRKMEAEKEGGAVNGSNI